MSIRTFYFISNMDWIPIAYCLSATAYRHTVNLSISKEYFKEVCSIRFDSLRIPFLIIIHLSNVWFTIESNEKHKYKQRIKQTNLLWSNSSNVKNKHISFGGFFIHLFIWILIFFYYQSRLKRINFWSNKFIENVIQQLTLSLLPQKNNNLWNEMIKRTYKNRTKLTFSFTIGTNRIFAFSHQFH